MHSIIVSLNHSLLSSYSFLGTMSGTEFKENTRDGRSNPAKRAYKIHLKSEYLPLPNFHIIGQIINGFVSFFPS